MCEKGYPRFHFRIDLSYLTELGNFPSINRHYTIGYFTVADCTSFIYWPLLLHACCCSLGSWSEPLPNGNFSQFGERVYHF